MCVGVGVYVCFRGGWLEGYVFCCNNLYYGFKKYPVYYYYYKNNNIKMSGEVIINLNVFYVALCSLYILFLINEALVVS